MIVPQRVAVPEYLTSQVATLIILVLDHVENDRFGASGFHHHHLNSST